MERSYLRRISGISVSEETIAAETLRWADAGSFAFSVVEKLIGGLPRLLWSFAGQGLDATKQPKNPFFSIRSVRCDDFLEWSGGQTGPQF